MHNHVGAACEPNQVLGWLRITRDDNRAPGEVDSVTDRRNERVAVLDVESRDSHAPMIMNHSLSDVAPLDGDDGIQRSAFWPSAKITGVCITNPAHKRRRTGRTQNA